MIKRAAEPFKNHFALPGGFVDYNEDPKDACLRELKEECNLDGFSPQLVIFLIIFIILIQLTVKSDPERDPRGHVVSFVYLVKIPETAMPKAGDDAASAEFYPLSEILAKETKLAFDHREILEELKIIE